MRTVLIVIRYTSFLAMVPLFYVAVVVGGAVLDWLSSLVDLPDRSSFYLLLEECPDNYCTHKAHLTWLGFAIGLILGPFLVVIGLLANATMLAVVILWFRGFLYPAAKLAAWAGIALGQLPPRIELPPGARTLRVMRWFLPYATFEKVVVDHVADWRDETFKALAAGERGRAFYLNGLHLVRLFAALVQDPSMQKLVAIIAAIGSFIWLAASRLG